MARIAHLLTIPCDLVRRTYAEDPNADGEQDATEVVEAGVLCELQQAGSREDSTDAVQIATYRLFLDDGAPLRGWDAVVVGGEYLELEGDAFAVTSPLTGDSHVEAVVRRTDYGEPPLVAPPPPEPEPEPEPVPLEAT